MRLLVLGAGYIGARAGELGLDAGHDVCLADNWYETDRDQLAGLEARGARVKTAVRGTLQEILVGPAHENDGRMNLFGALRTSMATCGYETVKEFQKAEVMVAPALQTEGKSLQNSQGIGMGS